MNLETIKRDRIFLRFEDADYFYREQAVSAIRQELAKAAETGEEVAEVKASGRLFRLLSCKADVAAKNRLFDECLLPMVEVISLPEACGYLYNLLGSTAYDLGRPNYCDYYRKAIERDNDAVFAREDVLADEPGLIVDWIRHRLPKDMRDSRMEQREQMLERLIADRSDAADYYLLLAELFQRGYPHRADACYRECIRRGCASVVRRTEFLRSEYEDEYLAWYERTCRAGMSAREAACHCLAGLWQTDLRGNKFSKSRQAYAESLYAQGEAALAAAEYVKGAEQGFQWAVAWICTHVGEPAVLEQFSDALVAKWYDEYREGGARQRVLGRYFAAHPQDDRAQSVKGRSCVAWMHLSDGDVIKAVYTCVEMEHLLASGGPSFLHLRGLNGFQKLSQELRASMMRNAGLLVAPEPVGPTVSLDSLDALPDYRFHPETLPEEDVRILQNYVQCGTLDVSAFRSPSTEPLCSRYLLLEQLGHGFNEGSSFAGLDRRTMAHLHQEFNALAYQEFLEGVQRTNPLMIVLWLNCYLWESPDVDDHRRIGEIALYRMVRAWQPGDCKLPLLYLAAYWQAQNRSREDLYALRLLIDDDASLREWIRAADNRALFSLAYACVTARRRR